MYNTRLSDVAEDLFIDASTLNKSLAAPYSLRTPKDHHITTTIAFYVYQVKT